MTSCFRAVQQLGTREGANGMFELSHTEQHKRRPPYVPNTAYASFGLAVPTACYRRELASCVASPSYAVIAALLHIRHCLLRIFGNTSVSTLWPYGEPGIWAARGMQSRNIALCSSICLLSKHRRASRSHISHVLPSAERNIFSACQWSYSSWFQSLTAYLYYPAVSISAANYTRMCTRLLHVCHTRHISKPHHQTSRRNGTPLYGDLTWMLVLLTSPCRVLPCKRCQWPCSTQELLHISATYVRCCRCAGHAGQLYSSQQALLKSASPDISSRVSLTNWLT